MALLRIAGISLLLMVTANAIAESQSPAATQQLNPAGLARLHQFIETKVEEKRIAGAVTVIARNGILADLKSYGFLNAEKQTPMPVDGIFRLYSMSKPITAVAALTLVEAGQLRLDDPVARYLPEFDNLTVVTGGDVEQPVVEPANKPLTIRHLLTHTAGIPYSSEGGSLAEKLSAQAKVGSAPTLADFSRRIAALPLANHPGERWQYGFSQDVLGRVIEVITGVGFDAYLAQTVFVPLAMHDTGFSVPRDKRDRLVPVHTSLESGQLAIYPNNPAPTGESILAFPAGGEGLFSTAGDYLRFAQMLHNGGELDGVRILSKPTVNMMMSNQLLGLPTQRIENGDYSYGLGIGLRVDLSTGELGSLGQYGWGGYATTDYFADSEYDFIWIYLSQHLPPDQNDVIRSLKNLVYQTIN